MSYNIDSVETRASTLRISKRNAKKAAKLRLPEGMDLDALKFGEDDFAPIEEVNWYGEGSGNAWHESAAEFFALTEGTADLILTWEGGDSHSGARVRSGKLEECAVIMTLAEPKPKRKGAA